VLHDCKTTTASSNLWMSKRANGIFALIINFLIANWQPKHVTLGLFEANETIGQALPKNLAYVKDEGSNLNTTIIALKSIVNYELLGLEESYQGCCFGHFFSKHVNMEQLMKNLHKVETCFHQICTIRYTKVHNLAQKV
jgi:hypothetical protein